jgi:hypothetical protein
MVYMPTYISLFVSRAYMLDRQRSVFFGDLSTCIRYFASKWVILPFNAKRTLLSAISWRVMR